MATHDRNGFPDPTDDESDIDAKTYQQDCSLRARLIDAGETLTEVVLDHPIRRCEPDGSNWLRTENRPGRKTWTRSHGDGDDVIEEQIQLQSTYPTSLWTVVHQRPDGMVITKAAGVSRERAYEIVESMIADFDGVRPENRTGRAAQ